MGSTGLAGGNAVGSDASGAGGPSAGTGELSTGCTVGQYHLAQEFGGKAQLVRSHVTKAVGLPQKSGGRRMVFGAAEKRLQVLGAKDGSPHQILSRNNGQAESAQN